MLYCFLSKNVVLSNFLYLIEYPAGKALPNVILCCFLYRVLFCWVTNYQQRSSLKQHTGAYSCELEVWHGIADFLGVTLQRVWLSLVFTWSFHGRTHIKILNLGRTWFSAIMGMKSAFQDSWSSYPSYKDNLYSFSHIFIFQSSMMKSFLNVEFFLLSPLPQFLVLRP